MISILRTHLTKQLPAPLKFVQEDGPVKYTLIAENRPWPFGKSLDLVWGEERLITSETKWTFKFKTLSESRHST